MKQIEWTSEKPGVLNLKSVYDALKADGIEFSPFKDEESVNNFLFKVCVDVYQAEKLIGNKHLILQKAVNRSDNKTIGMILIINGSEKYISPNSWQSTEECFN